MCGIAGIGSSTPIAGDDHSVVHAMLDKLEHRGPDGRGLVTDACAVLGHTRLAIIDPEGGRQPIANENGTKWITANCEIYNYRALRALLESKGHRFHTGSDAEVVLHLYEEIGAKCVEELRGIFAFAIWDAADRTLLLARDPIGVKPLYYALRGSRIGFASQLDALLCWRRIDRQVSLRAMHHYLTYHYVPSPETIIEGVRKLEPAESVTFRNGQVASRRYWDITIDPQHERRDEEWLACIRDRVHDAVRANLVADVPVGAFLSGGIDSGTVVANAARLTERPLQTFTMGFDDDRYDERTEARDLAGRLNAQHREEIARPDPTEIVEILSAAFDEPFGDPSAVPTYWVSRLAAGHVKTVLSGDGGDEVFAGYSRYVHHQRERHVRRLTARRIPRSMICAASSTLSRRWRSAAENFASDQAYAHYLSVAWYDPRETRGLFNEEATRALGDHDPFDVLASHFRRAGTCDQLAQSQYVDLRTWLADGVLCKTDRASMAHGLEVRVPLLDTPLLASVAALPAHLKIRGGRGKVALRRAMAPMLGEVWTNRRKRGFEVPLDDWFGGALKPMVDDLLLSPRARILEWIDRDAIRDVRRQHGRGRKGMGARLWALLMLELWARRTLSFEDSPPERHGGRVEWESGSPA